MSYFYKSLLASKVISHKVAISANQVLAFKKKCTKKIKIKKYNNKSKLY